MSEGKKSRHLHAVDKNPAKSEKGERTPWASIFLISIVTGVGGALAVRGIESFFRYLETRKERKAAPPALPPPQPAAPVPAFAAPGPAPFLAGPTPPVTTPQVVYVSSAPPTVPSSIPGAPQPVVLAAEPYTMPPWLSQYVAQQGQQIQALEAKVARLEGQRPRVVDDDDYEYDDDEEVG